MSIQGIGVSPGIVVGKAYVVDSEGFVLIRREIPEEQIEQEVERLTSAIRKTKAQLKRFQRKIKHELGPTHAAIFESHALLMDDPMLVDSAIKIIRKERMDAEHAVSEVLQKFIEKLKKFDDAYLRSRIVDFKDVIRRIQMNLVGVDRHPLAHLEEKVVVVAYDLTPSDTASMDKEKVIGFVTEVGSRTSHTAIMAKAFEIPAVVGASGVSKSVNTGDTVIIDGIHGTVIVNPDKATVKEYLDAQRKITIAEQELTKLRDLPAETLDGNRIVLSANIELADEVEHVKQHGSKGIGLFRTEFHYLNHIDLPTEEELFKSYKSVVKGIAPGYVVIRTLDIGGDKFSSKFDFAPEINPFLGCRAIRLCLQRPDIFKIQLRAILRASAFGHVKIMYPMISGLNELREANQFLEQTREELIKEGVKIGEEIEVGAMIEIPSAALIADVLAREVDFFSIGTNDLIQYTLAVDRVNEHVANLYDPLHPAVLRLIKNVVEASHRAGIWVSMCGEMAGDPAYTLILLGLGLDELSMAPSIIPEIKKIIRNVKISQAKKITEGIFELSNSEEIRDYLERHKIHLLSEGARN